MKDKLELYLMSKDFELKRIEIISFSINIDSLRYLSTKDGFKVEYILHDYRESLEYIKIMKNGILEMKITF